MIELMITVTLVAIVAAIGAPSMRTYILNNRLNSASQELLRTLQTARSEATKRQSDVIVCASEDPQATTPKCGTGTTAGWIMFVNQDADWDYDAGEVLLEAHTFDSNKMKLLAEGNRARGYAATGFAILGGTTAMVMCDSRGIVDSNGGTTGTTSVARGFIFDSATGRARITKTLTSTIPQGVAELKGATGGSC